MKNDLDENVKNEGENLNQEELNNESEPKEVVNEQINNNSSKKINKKQIIFILLLIIIFAFVIWSLGTIFTVDLGTKGDLELLPDDDNTNKKPPTETNQNNEPKQEVDGIKILTNDKKIQFLTYVEYDAELLGKKF